MSHKSRLLIFVGIMFVILCAITFIFVHIIVKPPRIQAVVMDIVLIIAISLPIIGVFTRGNRPVSHIQRLVRFIAPYALVAITLLGVYFGHPFIGFGIGIATFLGALAFYYLASGKIQYGRRLPPDYSPKKGEAMEIYGNSRKIIRLFSLLAMISFVGFSIFLFYYSSPIAGPVSLFLSVPLLLISVQFITGIAVDEWPKHILKLTGWRRNVVFIVPILFFVILAVSIFWFLRVK